jgi:catechol 2,3-dioxygenase-like lactoylglutathione lyase family enzyme
MPPGGEELAVAFYEGLLGITHIAKPARLAVRGGCWFEDENVRVHLGVDHEFRPARRAHPTLLVVDLPRLVQALHDADVHIADDERLEAYNRIYVDDPFGNRIELMEPTPPVQASS